MSQRNEFLDHGVSDESDAETGGGYDSEAAEVSRTERRGVKRRKISHSPASGSSEDEDERRPAAAEVATETSQEATLSVQNGVCRSHKIEEGEEDKDIQGREIDYTIKSAAHTLPKSSFKPSKKPKKEKTPGVIYLSSLPPYLKPSALRNLLSQRGFEPVTRLFLAPSSKHKHASKKNSRQLYSEGWIEFASKKTAKRCVEALNAQLIGGRKGGFYYDDLWNMKYLRGMSWEELMSGIREERREEEGRRDEERRRIAKETEAFVRGVEKSKQLEGIKRKRQKRDGDGEWDAGGEERTWKQHEAARGQKEKNRKANEFEPEVQQVLSKIF